MSWVKLDDRFPRHRRVRELQRDTAAKWLHVVALCHCAEHLTDGIVDAIAFAQIVGDAEIPKTAANRAAAKLEEAGLWVRHENGWVIRDYLDYNPLAESVKAKREARSEAGRAGGIQSGASRRGEANGEAIASALLEANANPVPVPVPKEQDQDLKPIVRLDDHRLVTESWTAQAPPLILHRDPYLKAAKTQRAIAKALTLYPAEDVTQAVTNYAIALGGAEYRWDYSWTLVDFLNRGLDKFVPEAMPLDNFRVKATNGNRPNMKYGRRDVSGTEMLALAERLKAERLADERKALAPG